MSDKGESSSQGLEERVKVDRKKFEQMLGDEAESFFGRVMKATNTLIMWPPKLKPGTKSKKDPHVRITGSPNSINQAKEMIFEQLDTRRNRVTLKMDVAFTDHSHIIGKGGRSIQRVMDETGCHIHFPDSNRTNTAEKSNQVSIAGSAEGVELSRRKIREMLPITVQFDLPLNNGLRSPPTLDPQSPQLQAIQQTYGITITFLCEGSKCSTNSYFASSRIITVAVRGTRSHLFGLRQGLAVLIEYLTGFRANSINVPMTMTIDVAIQHHSFIAGRAYCNNTNNNNLTINNNNNNSNISNTNNNSNNTSSSNALGCSRKTAIVVNGSDFDSVYDAWQELLGQLPLILIFDLKEGQDLDPVQVTKLMEEMPQISILIKPKQRQNTKSIVVRGPEKDSRLLFEVRRQLLQLDYPEPIQRHTVLMPTSSSSSLAANSQENLQMEALKAILEPNLGKPRQPTPYWHGLGFSKSVSEPMIKEERTIAGPLFSSNVIDERRTSYANDFTRNLQAKKSNVSPSLVDLNNNSPICVPTSNNNNRKVTSCLRLAVFLGRIGLVQYLSLFTQHNIDLEMLLSLGEGQLAELGLPYTHRRKLAIAIAEVKSMVQNNEQRGLSTFDAAPGAERSRRQKTGPSYDLKDVWPM